MDRIFVKLFGMVLLGQLSVANAVEPRIYQVNDFGAFAPHLSLEFGVDNNPLRSSDGSEEAMFLRLEPSVSYLVRQRNNQLTLGYQGDYYQYFEDYCRGNQTVRPGDCVSGSPSFDKASFQDHRLFLNGFLEISSRLRLNADLERNVDHQELGTGQSGTRSILNDLTEPDAWNLSLARAQLSYGAAQARGQVIGGITIVDRNFDSVRGDFSNLEERSVTPNVRLLYRLGTRTQLFAGLARSQVRGGNSERDRNRFLFGAELDSSAITSGSIEFSLVKEDFVDSIFTDIEYLGWDIELIWRPRRFSTVTIGAGRETQRGLFFDQRSLGLNTTIDVDWEHFWRDRFSTLVSVGFDLNEDQDIFTDAPDSEDEAVFFRFEGNYNIRRWLDVGGFVEIDSRDGRDTLDGTQESREYARTVFGLTANGTI